MCIFYKKNTAINHDSFKYEYLCRFFSSLSPLLFPLVLSLSLSRARSISAASCLLSRRPTTSLSPASLVPVSPLSARSSPLSSLSPPPSSHGLHFHSGVTSYGRRPSRRNGFGFGFIWFCFSDALPFAVVSWPATRVNVECCVSVLRWGFGLRRSSVIATNGTLTANSVPVSLVEVKAILLIQVVYNEL